MEKIWKKRQLQMAIGTIGRKKVSTDPVTSPARA